MPIVGTGIDLVSVERMAAALKRKGFAARVFAPAERRFCDSARAEKLRAARYATRFAAKEAFYKALGRYQKGLGWKDVAVKGGGRSAPKLVPSRKAAAALRKAGVSRLHLSLSHDGGFAAASVVLESEPSA